MDGIINVLKPPGMTSHDVVNILRRLTGIRRTGHTGTLDPGASGILPICVGKATRVSEYVLLMNKTYRAELSLGQATDTEDASGRTILVKPVPVLVQDTVIQTLAKFQGPRMQIPPMYSAVRVAGKKLYELARQGEEIVREPRQITIYKTRLLQILDHKILFDVTCSRGTYIRTLCREIAEALTTTGHMSYLLRTGVGPFSLANSFSFEELACLREASRLEEAVLPLDTALLHLPAVVLNENNVDRIRNGVSVTVDHDIPQGTEIRVYSPAEQFLALAVTEEAGQIRPRKVF